jgi:hypothetical protein
MLFGSAEVEGNEQRELLYVIRRRDEWEVVEEIHDFR